MLTPSLIEQAVSTSMVYLFRSLGTVWGVAASSTIVQNVLTRELPLALSGIHDKDKVVYLLALFKLSLSANLLVLDR